MATPTANTVPVIPLPRQPSIRIGDVERSHACDALAAHFSAGRLDGDELDERLAAAVAARTTADLRWTVADLPPLLQGTLTPPAGRKTPSRAANWRAWDVVVLLVLLTCLGVAGLAFLWLLSAGVGTGVFMLAGALSALVAGTGAAAATHLAHRSWDRYRARATIADDARS